MRDVTFRFAACFDKKQQYELTNAIIDWIEQTWPATDAALIALCREMTRKPSLPVLKALLAVKPTGLEDAYPTFQLQALFTKRQDIDVGVDRKAVAVESFMESERICLETNRVLRDRDDPHYGERAALIHKMQRKISRVLGPLPCLDDVDFGFGPGANIGCGKYTAVRYKLESDLTTTVGAATFFGCLHVNVHAWPGASRPQIVSGSRFATVAKSWKTDRGILIEPIFNSFVQKGLGGLIRNRMRRVGINLRDQSVNRFLAMMGSRYGKRATIDLRMASDTVAYLLVMDCLPWDWFEALDAARSPVCEMPDGKSVTLEKFSSMGNGATFELESLIFWALLSVVCEEEGEDSISVYGDDLICPSHKADEVIRCLNLLGFSVNVDKTFVDGPFRESCGADYWNGVDVRPFFLKEAWSAKEVFRVHNFLIRKGLAQANETLIQQLLDSVPVRARSYAPDTGNDGYLIGEGTIRYDKRGWSPYFVVQAWVAVPRIRKHGVMSSDYGAKLYTALRAAGSEDLEQSVEESIYGLRSERPVYRRVHITVPVVT